MAETSATSHEPLHGRRILIVEDIAILAFGIEDLLKRAGAEVVGPALNLETAERLADEETLSAALLDIRLDGDEVWSVARLLDQKGVPFVFCSGHFDRERLPVEWRERPLLVKPARAQDIIDTLAALFEAAICGGGR
jgi:DNA-binding response OmpR family regulator